MLRRRAAKVYRAAHHYYYISKLRELERAIQAQSAAAWSPTSIFRGVSDRFWFWLNTEGYRRSATLREVLPSLPDEWTQRRFTGGEGDNTLREGFSAYVLFKQIAERELKQSANQLTILDFGCGWGRIIRFFLKDTAASQIWGADCFDEVLKIAKQTNRWCSFKLIDTLPPSDFPNDTFDLIYCYSVFSHLSEAAHQQWLAEFSRILKPGGLLIATTRRRDFITRCAEMRGQANLPDHLRGIAMLSFPNTDQTLAAYDRGEFCHSPTGGGDILDSSFYGETCIPKGYVLSRWTKHFAFVVFIEDYRPLPQNVIVVKK